MISPIKFALIAAIPIEAANLLFAGYPTDVGLPPATIWYEKLIAYRWLFLHWLGLFLIDDTGINALNNFVFLASGYFDTALLIVLVIFSFGVVAVWPKELLSLETDLRARGACHLPALRS